MSVGVAARAKRRGGGLVDAGVGALGGEEDGDKKGVGIVVKVERDGRIGIETIEDRLDLFGATICQCRTWRR